jgi:hypothetical protein
MSRRRRRTVIVGNGVPAGIGGRLGVGEHERGSRKLSRGSVRAMGTRWRLSMVTRGSPEWRKERRRWRSGLGALGYRIEVNNRTAMRWGSSRARD